MRDQGPENPETMGANGSQMNEPDIDGRFSDRETSSQQKLPQPGTVVDETGTKGLGKALGPWGEQTDGPTRLKVNSTGVTKCRKVEIVLTTISTVDEGTPTSRTLEGRQTARTNGSQRAFSSPTAGNGRNWLKITLNGSLPLS